MSLFEKIYTAIEALPDVFEKIYIAVEALTDVFFLGLQFLLSIMSFIVVLYIMYLIITVLAGLA